MTPEELAIKNVGKQVNALKNYTYFYAKCIIA